MVDTKPLDAVRRKWEGAIGRVPQAYAEGISNVKDFQRKALEGQTLYEEKMRDPNVLARRARKLQEVSDEDWKKAAREKGAARIAAGMAASKEKFGRGMGRVLEIIQSVDLPPRTSDPEANVDNRVKPLVRALSKMKEE